MCLNVLEYFGCVGVLIVGVCWTVLECVGVLECCGALEALETLEALVAKVVKVGNH